MEKQKAPHQCNGSCEAWCGNCPVEEERRQERAQKERPVQPTPQSE